MDRRRARDRLPGAGLLARLRLSRRRDGRHRPRAPRRAGGAVHRRRGPAGHAGAASSATTRWSSPSAARPTTSARRACASTRSRSTRPARRRASTAAWSMPASARTRRPSRWRPSSCRWPSSAPGATGTELAAELHKTTRAARRLRARPHRSRQGHQDRPDRGGAAHPAGAARAAVEGGRRAARAARACAMHTRRAGRRGARRTACGWRAARRSRPSWWCGRPASRRPISCKDIGGLETNRINQLVVRPTLQTTRDDDIFAIGDCAACPWPGHDRPVPPRAQAAHQQASHLAQAAAAAPRTASR